MTSQKAFQEILTELQTLSPHLRLRLPASPSVLRQHIRQLSQAEQRLAEIENRIFVFVGRGHGLFASRAHHKLTELLKQMTQTVQFLRELAEEHATDPEGTAACLQMESSKHAILQARIKALSLEVNRPPGKRQPQLR